MFEKQQLKHKIATLKQDPNVAHWQTIPEKGADYSAFPDTLHDDVINALAKRGIDQLYCHQAHAFQASIKDRHHMVAVTPTASGKTLCYNLPVLHRYMENPNARALYLFPTKALAQDQMTELNLLIEDMETEIRSYTYDGDTPPAIRQTIRKAGHIVITNPDMLHSAILPHHTKWISLFENLETVVIDELHTYRGVFGSHVANVIRRLKRICAYYGSNPQFICTSATIANPVELAEELTGKDVQLIDNNGAPKGRKHFVLYNPPVVHPVLNIRKSATKMVNELAADFLKEGIQTIVFARSRVRVELILSHLQQLTKKDVRQGKIRGYRGGYLPSQRREIERDLRSGDTIGVVSTNALELGVDIGQLQVCVMTGYPGSIASSWQQAGRAGRRQDESLVIMVASASPLDQYLFMHPDYFFEHSPETARINKNNLIILVDHLKCAAYELPFQTEEQFDGVDVTDILDYLIEKRVLFKSRHQYHWMNDAFPAHNISLRSAAQENVVIIDQSDTAQHRVIGEMDTFSAMTLLHDEAIYLHEGTQFQVEKLDWDEKKAFVTEVDVDYFTDANLAVQLKVLEVDQEKPMGSHRSVYGDVMVRAMATIFKKMKLDSFENIGSGPIHLPEQELHTNGIALHLEQEALGDLSEDAWEQVLGSAAHVLRHVSSVHVMCDTADLYTAPQVKETLTGMPTIFIYDRYPGGVGLSERIYDQLPEVVEKALDFVYHCSCEGGCPTCCGEGAGSHDVQMKVWILKVFSSLLNDQGAV